MFFKLKKWFWTKRFEIKYRMVNPDVCCCGSSKCEGDSSHSYTNAKEYAIDLATRRAMGLVI